MRILRLLVCLRLLASSARAARSRPVAIGADGQVLDHSVVVTGMILVTDGTNDCTATLYDHKSAASGTQLSPVLTVAGADNYGGAMLPEVEARNGVYADLTTSGTCTVTVYYQERQ